MHKESRPKRKPRYYKTPYKEALKIKDLFVIPETQEYIEALFDRCDEYCSTRSVSQCNGYKHVLGNYVLSLDETFDARCIDGKYIADFYLSKPSRSEYLSPFTKDMIKQAFAMNACYHWHPDLEIAAEIIQPFINDIQNIHQTVIPLLSGEKDACKCKLYRTISFGTGNPLICLMEFDTDSRFIQDLLIEYQNTQHGTQPRVYHDLFFRKFAESLDFKIPKDIYGFNAETLMKQTVFFSSLKRESELENRYFYRFIINKQGTTPAITLSDGISMGYLLSEGFAKNYPAGYRYVPLNPNEGYPSFDKWAVSPNGLDQITAMDKPEHIRCLDFTRISDETVREAAKAWFWGVDKAGFENRCRNLIYITEFFEYRDMLRKGFLDKFIQVRAGEPIDTENTVLAEEIAMYTNEWDPKVTSQTYTSRISPLRRFLQYMMDQSIYQTEIAAFEYLNTSKRGQKKKQEILPVPKENFKRLIEVLERKANDNTLHMLYYIVFCLNTLTPLRISSILDLDVDCIVEKSKGIYAFSAKVKTEDGDFKEVQISRDVLRLVEVAISITAETRANAPDNQKHYLFLVNNQKSFYRSIPHRSYNKYLHDCCKEAGIPNYSAQNLRKTYYTNLVENAIKNNVSLMSLYELTMHANIDTTENHYVKESIRNYLEATYGVEIGTMPVVGEVVAEYPEAKDEDLVNDGCGYCRNPECNVLGTANCLMCPTKGFITTPDHAPQFEEAIAVISKQIVESTNPHDKEHLYAVKRLYVAYLEQLYLKKEAILNGTVN